MATNGARFEIYASLKGGESNIIGFNNRFFCTINRKIVLPKLDDYPIEVFSNVRSDFLKASGIFPVLRNEFLLLHRLQSEIEGAKFRWIDIFLLKTQQKNYIQMNFECKVNEKHSVERFLAALGI